MIYHQSKLSNVGNSIFSVMSTLANTHNAMNLAQGFPDFKSDQKLIDAVSNAMNSWFNQYAPMQGHLGLRHAISKNMSYSIILVTILKMKLPLQLELPKLFSL